MSAITTSTFGALPVEMREALVSPLRSYSKAKLKDVSVSLIAEDEIFGNSAVGKLAESLARTAKSSLMALSIPEFAGHPWRKMLELISMAKEASASSEEIVSTTEKMSDFLAKRYGGNHEQATVVSTVPVDKAPDVSPTLCVTPRLKGKPDFDGASPVMCVSDGVTSCLLGKIPNSNQYAMFSWPFQENDPMNALLDEGLTRSKAWDRWIDANAHDPKTEKYGPGNVRWNNPEVMLVGGNPSPGFITREMLDRIYEENKGYRNPDRDIAEARAMSAVAAGERFPQISPSEEHKDAFVTSIQRAQFDGKEPVLKVLLKTGGSSQTTLEAIFLRDVQRFEGVKPGDRLDLTGYMSPIGRKMAFIVQDAAHRPAQVIDYRDAVVVRVAPVRDSGKDRYLKVAARTSPGGAYVTMDVKVEPGLQGLDAVAVGDRVHLTGIMVPGIGQEILSVHQASREPVQIKNYDDAVVTKVWPARSSDKELQFTVIVPSASGRGHDKMDVVMARGTPGVEGLRRKDRVDLTGYMMPHEASERLHVQQVTRKPDLEVEAPQMRR